MENLNPYLLKTAVTKRNIWQNRILLHHHRHHSNDSGAVSDTDYIKSTMSSCESERSEGHGQTGWSSSSYSFSDSMPSSNGLRDYSTGGTSHSTESASHNSLSHESFMTHDPMLPELTQVPWTECDVLATLQKSKMKDYCGNISIECLQRLSYLLQRPLIRIAREAQRFSEMYNKCSKHDIRSACKIILSPHMYNESNIFASQSTLLYSMSAKNPNYSKSSLCSLSLSVGKHHRWLLEALPVGYIHELSAVYLVAVMEIIIEQTVYAALFGDNNNMHKLKEQQVITTEMLEAGIQRSTDLHRLYNPCSHLTSTATDSADLASSIIVKSASNRRKLSPTHCKTLERNLMAQCTSSLSELADFVSQAMHHWYEGSGNSQQLQWSSSAIDTLYYFMKCSQSDCCESKYPLISLKAERSYVAMPPVVEWVRVAAAFTEHRGDSLIDSDDVMQAARTFLPGVECPVRNSRYIPCATVPRSNARTNSASDLQRQFGLSLLASGVTELQKYATTLLSKSDIDYVNEQGMTPLMCACVRGDDLTVLTLLRSGADTEISISSNHVSCAGWTALCFAVSQGHFTIAKILLEHGCAVEGSVIRDMNISETPLQLASAAGHIEIVNLLLKNQADPHQNTYLQSGLEVKSCFNSFTLAASHGRKDVIRRLFGDTLKLKSCKLLTLSEMLAESCEQDLYKIQLEKSSQQKLQAEEENEYMVIENDYVTIEDVRQHEKKLTQLKEKLTSCHMYSLQISSFQAAENGFLDLTLEIHSAGVPWTMYTWYMTLGTAHIMQRKAIVQSLLKDFTAINRTENKNVLTDCCLPLMFDIFRESKNEMISQQLAAIFTLLYGPQPVPLLKDVRSHPSPIIESSYVNSPELADVSFIVEQKTFYAHKIILASASPRFKTMLSNFNNVPMPEIEIRDIDYQTFEGVVHYLYEGVCSTLFECNADIKSTRHLLGAAHYFQLDGLKRKCEISLSKSLSIVNCVSIYRAAKLYSCHDLIEICEAFFLQHLNRLLTKSEVFKRILYSTKVHNRELLNRLSHTLIARLSSKAINVSPETQSFVKS